jgi:hypothetical protein
MPDVLEAYDEAYDEGYEEEGYDEASRFRPRAVSTARPTALPPRPAERPVTQAQLQTAVTKLNSEIGRNSGAIQKVNTGLKTLGRDVHRQAGTVRDARKDIGQLRDAIVMMPLLSGALGGSSTLSMLFPMMLLSGVGESGSGHESGGMLGGDQSTMMLLVLAMSGSLGGKGA